MEAARAKVTSSGRITLPAELRHRWKVKTVLVIDQGDHAVVRPIPTDLIEHLRGSHAGTGPTLEQSRAADRERQ